VSDAGDGYPSVPRDRLDELGWELTAKHEETVFQVPGATVTGYTLVYGDEQLRAAMEDAGVDWPLAGADGDGDRFVGSDGGVWRFFFATALSFRPPLPPGIGPASLRPTVTARARRAFVEDLEARGFEAVESGREQRLRTKAGDRARLRKLTARLPLGDDRRIDVAAWIAVWTIRGEFRIAGGAYPVGGPDALFSSLPERERPPVDPERFREELLELIGAVE
jgi:hypothetical protein